MTGIGGYAVPGLDPAAYGLSPDRARELGYGEPGDPVLEHEAQRLWLEFWLHLHGVSYAAQGYTDETGAVLAYKMDEHVLTQALYNEAINEARKNARK